MGLSGCFGQLALVILFLFCVCWFGSVVLASVMCVFALCWMKLGVRGCREGGIVRDLRVDPVHSINLVCRYVRVVGVRWPSLIRLPPFFPCIGFAGCPCQILTQNQHTTQYSTTDSKQQFSAQIDAWRNCFAASRARFLRMLDLNLGPTST